jgi:polysaccharide pyruvyl transferase WcaK-like protein
MLGIDEVELYTDPCFYHDFLSGDASRTDQAISSHVGIVVREWNHDEAGKMHWRPLLEAADVLQERGIACTFILLDKKNDASIYRKLKNRNCLVWDPGGDSIGGFIDKMSSPFDIIISARAHGIILPAVKGVPGICIELEPKLFHVHRMLPRGTLLWGFPFSVSDLLDKVGMIYGDYDSFTRGIAHDVALNRNKAICSSQKITQWLDRVLRS